MIQNFKIRLLAASGAALLLLAACGQGDSKKSAAEADKVVLPKVAEAISLPDAVLPAGDGKAECAPDTALAFIGVLNGSSANLGRVQLNAAKLAIKEHNDNNPNCQVQLKVFDSEGSPDKAPGVATQAVTDEKVVGIIGLSFSGASQAVGGLLNEAGLVNITGSATNPTLADNGWNTFFRAVGNDNDQAPAGVALLDKLKSKKTFVINDDGAYGKVLGELVRKELGSKLAGQDGIIGNGSKDFSSTVAKVKSSKADAVYYAGYYAEAAALFTALRQSGFKGYLVGPDGIKDAELVKLAGENANETYMTCPCVDGSLVGKFAEAYKKAYNEEPGTYSADFYDITTIFLSGIDKGNVTREAMLNWVKNYDASGISKRYKFTDKGELVTPEVYYYRVDKDKIIPVGSYKK